MSLPQLERPFLTDGGLETDLIFNHGFDLPEFSSSTMFSSPERIKALKDYYRPYLDTAERHGVGFILESPSWRASPDWAPRLGLSRDELEARNVAAIDMMRDLRAAYAGRLPIVISGQVGPRGDGYVPGEAMTIEQAREYHRWQAGILAHAGAEMITAITMTNVNEAAGVALAAHDAGVPCAISFTVETDGRLPEGVTLGDAIRAVDAATDSYPAYYMVNCAHPDHFDAVLDADADWAPRLMGLRANASRMSHAELNEMEVLDDGNPDELGGQHRALMQRFAHLKVLGGCCGTDHRHIAAIADQCFPRR
ncbi:homocysteine S-methyltransferase family protein [Sphingomicrobium nitratireducens]|uniref:homocysteine S-methyltransferase family protein n=1 Tax=Sphingomicrobium nitratireducens TaxID=2964666 RepID=UPI00223F13EF|nr:homocysteine S-methyltransferase family protein [Sphingomicrobium nitratireducens]